MTDAGGPGSVRKCPLMALADLGDTEGFDKDGEENQLYAFQLSDGVYKRRKVTQGGSLKFEVLSDVDVSYATRKRVHTLVFTQGKWFPFADPVPHGWHIDVKLVPPYAMTRKQHKVWKIVNSGTQLCSYIPKQINIVISNTYAI